MAAQQGYFDTLKSVAGKVFTYLASIKLTGTDGKTLTVSDNTTLAGPASETIAGPIEIATNAEAIAGTDTERATTSANLTARLAEPGAIGKTTPSEGQFSPVISRGPAAVTSGFTGTVTAAASTTVTFSVAADAVLAGYHATSPILGTTLISNALTRYIVSWNSATECVVDSAVTWEGTAITSTQFPVAVFVNSSGVAKGWMLASGNVYFVDKVGIGTTVQAVQLQVESAANVPTVKVISLSGNHDAAMTIENQNAGTYSSGLTIDLPNIAHANGRLLDVSSNGVRRFFVGGDGSVGIGMTPTVQFELSGSIGQKASGTTWSNPSDSRLKKDIKLADLNRCWEIVKSIPLKRYTLRDDVFGAKQAEDRSKLGWIAEDVKPFFAKATPMVTFTLPTEIPDGEAECQEQDFEIMKVETSVIEIIDGKPVLIKKMEKRKEMLFSDVEVKDEQGNVLFANGKPLIHRVPRMVTKTRPKFRREVIEDCLTLDADQIYAAMYGCIQLLMEKVELLESKTTK